MISKAKNSINWFKVGFSLLLNFVIILNLSLNSFHELEFHDHSTEQVCNVEFEKDACHRYLVHHEESASCNKTHKHITSKSEDCFVCKYFKDKHPESVHSAYIQSFLTTCTNFEFQNYQGSFISQSILCSYLRGPPVYTL